MEGGIRVIERDRQGGGLARAASGGMGGQNVLGRPAMSHPKGAHNGPCGLGMGLAGDTPETVDSAWGGGHIP